MFFFILQSTLDATFAKDNNNSLLPELRGNPKVFKRPSIQLSNLVWIKMLQYICNTNPDPLDTERTNLYKCILHRCPDSTFWICYVLFQIPHANVYSDTHGRFSKPYFSWNRALISICSRSWFAQPWSDFEHKGMPTHTAIPIPISTIMICDFAPPNARMHLALSTYRSVVCGVHVCARSCTFCAFPGAHKDVDAGAHTNSTTRSWSVPLYLPIIISNCTVQCGGDRVAPPGPPRPSDHNQHNAQSTRHPSLRRVQPSVVLAVSMCVYVYVPHGV